MTSFPNIITCAKPPIGELVVGIQYLPISGYSQIYAGEVYNLFAKQYPIVEDHPALPQSYETFGFSGSANKVGLKLVNGASHDRFWFLTERGNDLIQFQADRFLHNWRKVAAKPAEYPRFRSLVSSFEKELKALDAFYKSGFDQSLSINQCEVSYVNHIMIDELDGLPPSKLFSVVNFPAEYSEWSFGVSEILKDSRGKPFARLETSIASAAIHGRMGLQFSLTCRGTPEGSNISHALDFMATARENILSKFQEFTSAEAHKLWGVENGK